MQYKTILKPYDLAMLIGSEGGDAKSQAAIEPLDWNNTLNKYAKDGWIIKTNGAIQSGGNLIFWVLLEKAEQEQAINAGF